MNNKEEQSKRSYNKKAANYENTFDGKFTDSFKAELIEKVRLKEGYKVLDVACGTGELLNGLKKKCSIVGTGIDISDKMVEVAGERHKDLTFMVSSCVPLPFEDSSFDVLTVSAAFHHFPKPENFAREAFRVLKSDGILYIAEVSVPEGLRQIFNIFVLPFYRAGDVKVYSSKELTKIFEKAGFKDIQIEQNGKIQFLRGTKRG